MMACLPALLCRYSKSDRLWVRSKSMCIYSCITLNSSYIACGEYASHTLTGRQASSMAKTTAIDSGEKTRAKGDFSASHPDSWGDFPDSRRFLRSSSVNTGRNSGRTIQLGSVLGEKRTSCIEKQCKTLILSTA